LKQQDSLFSGFFEKTSFYSTPFFRNSDQS